MWPNQCANFLANTALLGAILTNFHGSGTCFRQNNGTPLDVNGGNDDVGVAANNENNVVVNVVANDAPVEDDLNVAAVTERVGNVNLGDGPALNGPVVNAERVIELAARTRNAANGPEDQDSEDDSDDSSGNEARINRLSVAECVRLRCRVQNVFWGVVANPNG